jgi:hypothetical protein
MISIKMLSTVAVLSSLFVSGSVFAGGGPPPSEDIGGGSSSHGITARQEPVPAPTTAELQEQLRAIQLQRAIAQEEAKLREDQERLSQAQAKAKFEQPPLIFESFLAALSGGRPIDRVAHNTDKELERFGQSLNNFLGGKGWKHDKSLARKAEKKAKKAALKGKK